MHLVAAQRNPIQYSGRHPAPLAHLGPWFFPSDSDLAFAMHMKKYLGSCHCGGVRFEIETQQALGPYFRCNCSLCARKGAMMGAAPREALTVVAGENLLSTYTWNTHEAQHYFCKVCGIYTHHVMRGETTIVGMNMACIEGFDVHAQGEVEVGDGKANWSLVHGAPGA